MPFNLFLRGRIIPVDTFKYGVKRYLKLKTSQSLGPKEGLLWKVVAGSIYHATGTASKLFALNIIEKSPITMVEYYCEVASGSGTGWYPLTNLPSNLILTPNDDLLFTGKAGDAYGTIILIESKDEIVAPERRKGFWRFL